jgi:hypothetical protein
VSGRREEEVGQITVTNSEGEELGSFEVEEGVEVLVSNGKITVGLTALADKEEDVEELDLGGGEEE